MEVRNSNVLLLIILIINEKKPQRLTDRKRDWHSNCWYKLWFQKHFVFPPSVLQITKYTHASYLLTENVKRCLDKLATGSKFKI